MVVLLYSWFGEATEITVTLEDNKRAPLKIRLFIDGLEF